MTDKPVDDLEFSYMNPADVDIAACWRGIEDLETLVCKPGQIQVQCAADPKFGPLLEESSSKLFALLWKVTDFNNKISDADQTKIGELATSVNKIYSAFLASRFGIAASFMQMLPPQEFFVELRPAGEATGMSPEILERIKKQVDDLGLSPDGKNPGLIAGKLKPSLNSIMTAGMLAAGGQEQFAKLQVEVLESIPQDFRAHSNIMMTSQFIGATIKALTGFSHQKNMVMLSIMGPLEAVMAARRMVGAGFAGTWGQSTDSTAAMITSMMLEGITRTLANENKESSEAITNEIIENMIKRANTPGNGTIN